MKRVLRFFFAITVVFSLYVPSVAAVADVIKTATKAEFVYLIVGLDDAAENTDSMLLLAYDSTDNTASVVQLPRDTYFNSESNINKINGLYSSHKLSGMTSDGAMQSLSRLLSELLCIDIDGYFAVTTELFMDAVDAIGGVEINLPSEFEYISADGGYSFKLKKGKNLLDGRMSVAFIRHRKSYLMGDLGRIDAQKIFISGLYDTLRYTPDYDNLIKASLAISRRAVTDFSITDFLIMMLKHSSKFRSVEMSYVTMPGESVRDASGVWYYVLNRKASMEVAQNFLFAKGDVFDPRRSFSNPQNKDFEEIYNSNLIKYKKYTSGDIAEIDIAKKNSH